MGLSDLDRTHANELSWPDDVLVAWAASVVSVPRRDPADSFVLHAPLELMARAELLGSLEGDARDVARRRIIELAEAYRGSGSPVTTPVPPTTRTTSTSFSALRAALAASDLDEIDRHALWLGATLPSGELAAMLAEGLAPSLAAAAHSTIGLELLGRAPEIPGTILRGALREVGRHPDWLVDWEGLGEGDRPLVDALLSVEALGAPDSTFIRPMVAHGAHVARRVLRDVSVEPLEASRALSRVAAWSMLQEPDQHAPYGWTHTLTIPQSVMSIGVEPRLAVSVAASQCVGFRASMGTVRLEASLEFPAASAEQWRELSDVASRHHDAHFVKYTLACRDAARADEAASGLYLAAAGRLADFWHSRERATATATS